MVSTIKSRGVGLMQIHKEKPERLDRPFLVIAIALYWAVSRGAAEARKSAERGENGGSKTPKVPLLPLQAGPAFPATLHRRLRQNPKAYGGRRKLPNGETHAYKQSNRMNDRIPSVTAAVWRSLASERFVLLALIATLGRTYPICESACPRQRIRFLFAPSPDSLVHLSDDSEVNHLYTPTLRRI